MPWYITVVIAVIAAAISFFLGVTYRKKVAEKEISSAEEEARRIINEAIKSSESKKREALLEAKEEILHSRTEFEKEEKSRRADLQKHDHSSIIFSVNGSITGEGSTASQ